MRILAHFLYVAVVCDTDGSAFITKAEFDSLKNNFQAQIDNYNQSIDSKIDGAIASYLAGIKVNTDDTPEFRIFGASYGPAPHIWNGKPANYFRLVESQNQIWGTQATSLDRCVHITSRAKTNRGYGYGWWITACTSASGTITFDEASGLVQSSKPKGEFTTTADNQIKTKAPGEATAQLTTCTTDLNTINTKTLFNGPLSDVFQQGITMYDPEFIFYEFCDSGTAQISVGCASNGYAYEGSTWGGYNADAGWHNFASGAKEVGIYLRHGSTDTLLISLKGKQDASGWKVKADVDVQAGDQVVWKRAADNTQTAQTNAYAIYWFSQTIPGWNVRTS